MAAFEYITKAKISFPKERDVNSIDTKVVEFKKIVEETQISLDESLFTFRVPKIIKNDDGTEATACTHELAPEPYDLRGIFSAHSESILPLLGRLHALVEAAKLRTSADWVLLSINDLPFSLESTSACPRLMGARCL
jgi:hypothetical protein